MRLVTDRKPSSLGDGIHQVLQVREYVGVRLVAVLGHDIAINNYIKLAVGTGGKLKRGNRVSGPTQSFACHPGSAQSVASILTVKNFHVELLFSSHIPPH